MNFLYFFCVLFLFVFSSISAAYDPNEWIHLTDIYVSKKAPTQEQVIFVNSYTGVGPIAGEWHTVDMSSALPSDAKAVNLVGILIITHGSTNEIADLELFFRAYGQTDYYIYPGQVIEASTGNGQRSTMSVWVPLSDDMKFEFFWTRSNTGNWPTWSAYGINLSLNAWGK